MLQNVMRPFIWGWISIPGMIKIFKMDDDAQRILNIFITKLKEYARFVEEEPKEVKRIAERFLETLHPNWHIVLHLDEILLRNILQRAEQREYKYLESLIKGLRKHIERVSMVNPRFAEALEILLEDAITKLRWLLRNPEKYSKGMNEFLEYKSDAYEYTILHVSSLLLLKVLSKNIPLWFVQVGETENSNR